MITQTDIRKFAKLARLRLSDAEVTKFASELDDVLEFAAQLKDVDTTGVRPIAQITGVENIKRPDVAADSGIEAALLACSPNRIVDGQVAVQNTLK